jgi:hypothetical protein
MSRKEKDPVMDRMWKLMIPMHLALWCGGDPGASRGIPNQPQVREGYRNPAETDIRPYNANTESRDYQAH